MTMAPTHKSMQCIREETQHGPPPGFVCLPLRCSLLRGHWQRMSTQLPKQRQVWKKPRPGRHCVPNSEIVVQKSICKICFAEYVCWVACCCLLTKLLKHACIDHLPKHEVSNFSYALKLTNEKFSNIMLLYLIGQYSSNEIVLCMYMSQWNISIYFTEPMKYLHIVLWANEIAAKPLFRVHWHWQWLTRTIPRWCLVWTLRFIFNSTTYVTKDRFSRAETKSVNVWEW